MGCACVLVAASKRNLGLTIEELAVRCEVKVNLLQRMVWRVCKATGLRVSRTSDNAEALLARVSRHFGITQTGAGAGVRLDFGEILMVLKHFEAKTGSLTPLRGLCCARLGGVRRRFGLRLQARVRGQPRSLTHE